LPLTAFNFFVSSAVCITLPSEYIASKLVAITDQQLDQEKGGSHTDCKMQVAVGQMSFYSLKPGLNLVPEILTAKDVCGLFADTKICLKINPVLGVQLKNASAPIQDLG